MNRLAVLFVLLLAPTAFAQTQADPEASSGFQAKALVSAKEHLIVSANPYASAAGSEIMAQGGSAADAAIAAMLVLGVVEPQSSGLGGGAFALVDGPVGLTTFDARETAPAAATPEMFMKDGETMPFMDAVASGRSIGTPGQVRLLETLFDRYGKSRWSDLFQPAIKLARDGFPVSPRLAGLLERYGDRLRKTDLAPLFLPKGRPLIEGDLLRQPMLARSLELIAANGADAFYGGDIASSIAASVVREPLAGTLTLSDLASYRVIERPAVCHPFRDHTVCGMGPPSSGATTVGQILMLLDRFKPDELSLYESRLWHLFAEASRLAYADRARFLADADFVKVPVKGLLDPVYMDDRVRLIDPISASETKATAGDPPWREGRLYAPDNQRSRPGTTHLSVIDGDGLAISVTASIETAFGSGRMAAGMILNNQLTDFSFRPASEDGKPIANAVAPGKRPRSSMAPTMAFEGDRLVAIAGSPGGSRIPEYVAQSLVAMLAYDLDPAAAAALPHVSHRNRGSVAVETHLAPQIVDGLKSRGHVVEEREMTSGLHLILVQKDGTMLGGADPRREGLAIGR